MTLTKKKYHYTIQLGGEELPVYVSNRPAQPWFDWDVLTGEHQITLDIENQVDFEGTVPHIRLRNGDGVVIEEWELIDVKLKIANADELNNRWSYTIGYSNTVYTSHMLGL